MSNYNWQCQVCNNVNDGMVSTCTRCGCPSEVNAFEIESRKRTYEQGGKYTGPNTRKLPVTLIVREAIQIVWSKRFRLLQALMGTGLAMTFLQTLSEHINSGWFGLLVFVANGILLTLFAVSCHRIVLLGDDKVPRYGIWSWSQREMRFIGWTIVGYFYFSAVLAILGIMIGLIGGLFFKSPYDLTVFQVLMFAAFFPSSYVMARLAILLPASAIDERQNMSWAWNLSSNNGWRLVVIVALLPWVLEVFLGSLKQTSYWGIEFILNFMGVILLAIEIAALSISFRFLSLADSVTSDVNSGASSTAETVLEGRS